MTDLQVTQKAPSLASKGNFATDPILRPYRISIGYEIEPVPEDYTISPRSFEMPERFDSQGMDYEDWEEDLREELNCFLNKQHDYCSLYTTVTPIWLGNDGNYYEYHDFMDPLNTKTGDLYAEPETYVASYTSLVTGGGVGDREFTTFSAKLALDSAWGKVDDEVLVSQIDKIGVEDPLWSDGDDETGLEVL